MRDSAAENTMSQRDAITLFWFRRDLRPEDNVGLYHALQSGRPVLPVFIFDTGILDRLEEKADRRVTFITAALGELNKKLMAAGSSLKVLHGTPETAFQKILGEYDIKAVFTNRDYEPYAIARDERISGLLKASGIPFHSFKDQVIFEKNEVSKSDGTPYTVFTPYSRAWKKQLTPQHTATFDTAKYSGNFLQTSPAAIPRPEEIGFSDSATVSPVPVINSDIIRNYHLTRNIPSLEGTTRLGVHLRFGTVSIRSLVRTALDLNETWLNELIWREFFMSILWHFPHVTDKSFRPKYDAILWRNNEEEFARWCDGMTGYPIVDAGMRELNATGFMHNRVRMITASFLTKHLLIDWRWGRHTSPANSLITSSHQITATGNGPPAQAAMRHPTSECSILLNRPVSLIPGSGMCAGGCTSLKPPPIPNLWLTMPWHVSVLWKPIRQDSAAASENTIAQPLTF